MLTEKELKVLLERTRGKGQAQIAKELKITQAAVSQFESNARKKIIAAERVREALKETNIRVVKGPLGDKVVWGEKK